mmetsp:Transcript_25271/g.50400  ORF Transcript_25271/g.50400 Transcript_25271/m.50400 type:complete len:225 (+) Transcript_25271:478-1152(+)
MVEVPPLQAQGLGGHRPEQVEQHVPRRGVARAVEEASGAAAHRRPPLLEVLEPLGVEPPDGLREVPEPRVLPPVPVLDPREDWVPGKVLPRPSRRGVHHDKVLVHVDLPPKVRPVNVLHPPNVRVAGRHATQVPGDVVPDARVVELQQQAAGGVGDVLEPGPPPVPPQAVVSERGGVARVYFEGFVEGAAVTVPAGGAPHVLHAHAGQGGGGRAGGDEVHVLGR